MRGRANALLFAGLAALVLASGCASRGTPSAEAGALHLSEVDAGDPTRRASLRLVLDGLEADAAGRERQGTGYYERALQIDPTNPYAYLALARRELESGDPRRALDTLDRCERLLDAEGARSPGADAHLFGLRGAALSALGRDGRPDLDRAARLAPSVWDDGRLDAWELR